MEQPFKTIKMPKGEMSEARIHEAEVLLQKVCRELQIDDDIPDEALKLYKNTHYRTDLKHLSPKSVLAGSLLVALKLHKELISLREVTDAFNEDITEVGKASHTLYRSYIDNESVVFSHSAGGFKAMVYNLGELLDLYGHTIDDAETLLKRAYKVGVNSEKSWYDVAGATIFIAASKNGEKITLDDVAKASKIDKKVLLNRIKEMYIKLNLKR